MVLASAANICKPNLYSLYLYYRATVGDPVCFRCIISEDTGVILDITKAVKSTLVIYSIGKDGQAYGDKKCIGV